MDDGRLSDWNWELGMARESGSERVSIVDRWASKMAQRDPTPREEIARVFYADALKAVLH